METSRTIFTGMEAKDWKRGLKWVRSVKQAGVTVAVVNMGLESDHLAKLHELNVTIFDNNKKLNTPQADLFNSMIPYMEGREGKFLFWDTEADAEDVNALWGVWNFGAAKDNEETSISALVYPLVSIDTRVKLSNHLETYVVPDYGSLLSGRLMAGTTYGWRLFTSFYNTLIETGTIEGMVSGRALAVNLFALYFKEWMEGKPVSYILQSEKME
jgi:hypothetical protein